MLRDYIKSIVKDALPKDETLSTVERLRMEVESLTTQKENLTIEVAELKHRHKLESEDIEHMVRIKEERMEVEFERKTLQQQRDADAKIEEIKSDYTRKLHDRLESEVERIQEMYAEVLARLPNVTAY